MIQELDGRFIGPSLFILAIISDEHAESIVRIRITTAPSQQ